MNNRFDLFALLVVGIVFVVVLLSSYMIYTLIGFNMPNNQFIEIEKTSVGYNTYKNGFLQYEFTKQNTDSLSLETLKMIYEGEWYEFIIW